MYKFSEQSQHHLKTCNLDLIKLFTEVLKEYDCTILEGHRDYMEQERAFFAGNSKVEYPNSKHNMQPSLAVDVSPYPIDWADTKRFYHFAGYVKGVANQLGIKIRWGGDWDSDNDFKDNSFNDLIHFELVF